jgi:hypothetical protein
MNKINKIISGILFFILTASICNAQDKKEKKVIGLGLKAGYNFAKVTGASSINAANNNGFHIGAFYSPGSANQAKGRGYRTEIIYSRQGYNFASGNTTGEVRLDYILLPQLATFNITKFVQIQAGAQLAFLINASADSSVTTTATNPYNKLMDYYNKIDYGFAGGIEVHPISGLMIGARFNISLANANKEIQPGIPYPPGVPNVSGSNLRNNVLQVFAGWQF